MTSPITHEKIIEVLRPLARYAELWPDYSDAAVIHTIYVEGGAYTLRLGDARAARDLYQRLQAEKGGGTVAPPASANAGTGRATLGNGGDLLDALLDAHQAYEGAATDDAARAARKKYLAAKQALLDHIVAMYAEGERIGIEKAAKDAADKVADRIRIPTNTGDPQT